MRCRRLFAASIFSLALLPCATPAAPPQSGKSPRQKSERPARAGRPPKPEPLGRGLILQRDSTTGELHAPPPASSAPGAPGMIRSRVTLVQVACTVMAPDGTQVRGLTAQNFRLYEDGVEQKIASLDASATPASIVLVIDASPSIYRELAQMRDAARALAAELSPADEIAVVSFSDAAHLLLPFSTDRVLLDRVLGSEYLAQVENSSQSYIYQAVFLASRELLASRAGRKAIVLLTDGQDSGLGLTWDPASASPGYGRAASQIAFDDVARELASHNIALFIVSTENRPKVMTPVWLAAHASEMLVSKNARRVEIPLYTLYLAELERRVGGDLYFLREIGDLKEIYRRIALTIRAQYTLGYYPSAGTTRPGWRRLRVELVPGGSLPAGARLTHRVSYYAPAFP